MFYLLFPSPILKALSETIDKTNDIISNSNFYDDIMDYESLYRNHFFLTPEMWDEQIYNSEDSILLSLCSTEYNRDDYIENWEDFVNENC